MICRRVFVAMVLTIGLAVPAGCGVPTGGAPTTIAASDIPYGLAEPRPTATAPPSTTSRMDPARIVLVGDGDVLVARSRDIGGSSRRARLKQLLAALAEGPSDAERDEQLSTALPPEVRLTLAGVSDGVATVDIDGPAEAPSGWASRRAVAQIVLTATSVTGVDAVRLTLSGDPVEAPLPSGELTSEPLTAADYEVLRTASPSPPP